MAQVHSAPSRRHDPSSELKTFEALQALPDDWHILHSVAWIGPRGNRVGDGEADFVLIHPSHGIIVLEVKGGGIEVERGRWRSIGRSRTYEIKDPYRQATQSKVNLYKWLKRTQGLDVPTGHGVVFPDLRTVKSLGPHAPKSITIDSEELIRIEEKISEVVAEWRLSASLTTKDINKVVRALEPRVSVRRTISDEAFDAESSLIKLTHEQVRAFAGMRRNRRAVVFGGPGTGKTILAVEKAIEFRDHGERVLLVCYNKLLQTKLARDERLDGVTVVTFHGLCASELRRADRTMPQKPSAEWWAREAPAQLIDAMSECGTGFDAIVVDEGQDFSQDWIDALHVAGSAGTDTPFYIFADENQTLWPRDWMAPSDWPVFELTMNCRNTRQIIGRMECILPSSFDPTEVSGPDPRLTKLHPSDDPLAATQHIVQHLIDEGFSPSEIVVLCQDSVTALKLRETALATSVFCEFGGRGVAVETIGRFKGLEARAVVAVLASDGDTPDREAYVAFSRARTHLEVIAPRKRGDALSWN